MGRIRIIALLAAIPLCAGACGGKDSPSSPTAVGVSVECQLLDDHTRFDAVPIAPARESWYGRRDDPATPSNEAAWDIACATDPPKGDLARHTYDWITRGGRVVIFVGGTGKEKSRSDQHPPIQKWLRDLSRERHGCAVVPMIQIDYWIDTLFNIGEVEYNHLNYLPSFERGLRRCKKLVRKAISAGSRDVVLVGHSKGGDIVGNAVAALSDLPELTQGLGFGIPNADFIAFQVSSLISPDWNSAFRRAGLFRYDAHNGRSFRGKLTVFNKFSDRWANNRQSLIFWRLADQGHDYARVWQDPHFLQAVRRVTEGSFPYADPAVGKQFDF